MVFTFQVCKCVSVCSSEEAARYLETYKAYENKPPDILKERVESDTTGRVNVLHFYYIITLDHMLGSWVLDQCKEDQQIKCSHVDWFF